MSTEDTSKRTRVPLRLGPGHRETLVIGTHTRDQAQRIALALTAGAHGVATVTRAEVMRRAVVIGLEALAKELALDDGEKRR